MIDSQPSASQPRNSRVPGRRQTVHRQKPVSRQVLGSGARWKVQLELAPAEIALVYRQGLAHGAEVRRHGTQEWRPLVTTPELRAALAASKQLSTTLSSRPVKAAPVEPQATVAIRDPSLAALLSPQRSTAPSERLPPLPTFAVPPPPPVLHLTASVRPTPPREAVPDSAVTQPMATRALPQFQLDPPVMTFTPSGSVRSSAAHARPAELSFVAVAAVAITLVVMLLVQRASHWGEARAQIAVAADAARAAQPAPASAPPLSAPLKATFSSSIPVVTVHQLPVERGLLGSSAPRSRSSSAAGADRAAFARAMSHAASSAQNCGPGPVRTRVVATFAPSGVPRAVHFASTPPSAALRSCVLSAVARSRVSPFVGEPVTVSKNLSW